MKNVITFIIIFGLGALCYALLTYFFTPKQVPQQDDTNRATTTTVETSIEKEVVPEEQVKVETDRPVVITTDGSLLDGPFLIFDKDGNETKATVRIIRSPEETLLQFEDWDEAYGNASHVYFADDLQATNYFNLAPAKMREDYLVYGIPLNARLESYSYILIYDTQLDTTEYYAKIR